MASQFCTGAVHLFAGSMVPIAPAVPATVPGAMAYLGTCENFPQRQTSRNFKHLQNDLSSQQPFDYIYAGGEEAVISVVLTRWNEPLALALESSPVSAAVGSCNLSDMGTIMGQEGKALQIALVYQFGAGRPSMPGMEAGRRYVQCLFWGPEQDETGSKERKKHMVFRAWKQYNPSTQTFTLFNFNVAGLLATIN